jgi:phage minor structural protein
MIQIYKPTNTDYTKNGDMVLFPESCEVHAKLNGEWYLDIEHPLDKEGRWKEIVEEAVISAPTFMGKEQLFRIDDMEKTDTEVKAKAYPIFFDSADELFVYSCKPAFKGAQATLDMLMSGSRYSGESNIARTSSAEFVNRNLMDCINGDDPAFIKYWGGDVLYDNYKVIINERAGTNRGLQIRYRKNMESISCKVDMSEVVTRIVPIAYNGRRITGNYVDSPNIAKYAKIYTRMMEFSNVKLSADLGEDEEPEDGVTVCYSQSQLDSVLKNLCNEKFSEGIDKPGMTLNVDMVDLSGTEEYKEFKQLEQVSLGDTVGVYHKELDINTEERCIELTWDCIRNRASKLVLGNYEYDYFTEANDVALKKMRQNYEKIIEAWKKKFGEAIDKVTGDSSGDNTGGSTGGSTGGDSGNTGGGEDIGGGDDSGDVEVPTEHTHNKLQHTDGIGEVVLVKDGGFYFLRPSAAGDVVLGGQSYAWYNVWTERLNVTGERLKCLPTWDNTCTYEPNVYVGNTGMFTRTTATSSKTIKHDIEELGSLETLDPKKLYDVDVVQFKYNEDIITDKDDARYGKDLPGFIIEDLAEKYPVVVDRPSDNVKEWSWNQRYMIPAMLKLIQEQNERIKMLEQKKGGK